MPAVVLAPMEGVTDAPMRALLTELPGLTYCVSEFLRVSQDVPPLRTFHEHVPELRESAMTLAEVPVQVQLLGGDPDRLAASALRAVQAGATGIDLNFGCPAPTVNRHDGGASLLRHPDRIRTIVRAVRTAVPSGVPVSAKLRLGWERTEDIHLNADRAAEGGASWITIHGRTRMQGYAPPAHWEPIGEVRRRLGIPVVANGDLWTLEDFRRCREVTGCDHYMIGRSAVADPDLQARISVELGLPVPEFRPLGDDPRLWQRLFRRFVELSRAYCDRPPYLPARMKQWGGMIRARRKGPAFDWCERMKRLQTVDEILAAIC